MSRRLDEAQAVSKKRNVPQDPFEDGPWGQLTASDNARSAYVSREEMDARQGEIMKMINEMKGVKREASEELEESRVRTSRYRGSRYPSPQPVDSYRPRYGHSPRPINHPHPSRTHLIRTRESTNGPYPQQSVNPPSLPHKRFRDMRTLREVEDVLAVINAKLRVEGVRYPYPRAEEIVHLHREREQALQRHIEIDCARPAVSQAHKMQREMLISGKSAPSAPTMAVNQGMAPPAAVSQGMHRPTAPQGMTPPSARQGTPRPPTAPQGATNGRTPLVVGIMTHFKHLMGSLEHLEGAFQPHGNKKGEAAEIASELRGHATKLLVITQKTADVLIKKERDTMAAGDRSSGSYGGLRGQAATSGSQRGNSVLPAGLPPGTPRGPRGGRRPTAADMMGEAEMSDGVRSMRL
ncbi:MAG: hypothetical protein Q9174_005969 [Haloplaca sp. 1 TL-2023]